ncbi:MAG: DUF393 domain-containing protein [Planctomycetes bacterium]|nr:DUF393 domain-containing protein [Planctomycetota bacterium]
MAQALSVGRLTVLYDAQCGLCRRARRWLEAQPAYVPLEFVAAGSPAARAFPASRSCRLSSNCTSSHPTGACGVARARG